MASTDPRQLAPLPDPQPENACQAVAMVRDDARWVSSKPDLNSTDGIKRNVEALWAAIDRLAAYIDNASPSRPANQHPDRDAEHKRNGNTARSR